MIKKLFIIQIIIFVGFTVFMFKEELGLAKPMHHMNYIDRVPVQGIDYPNPDGSLIMYEPCVIDDDPYTAGCQATPIISISEPQEKDVWYGGSSYFINWEYKERKPVMIELCAVYTNANPQPKCTTLAENKSYTGSISYTVPPQTQGTSTGTAILLVVDPENKSNAGSVRLTLQNSSLFESLGLGLSVGR